MLLLLSPAKRLDLSDAPSPPPTRPRFAAEAGRLAAVLRGRTAGELKSLMGLSDDLAALNRERFQAFGSGEARPAVLSFAGDVYRGLDARSLDGDALARAQDRLRILSGLYGVLRPLDAIEPYRLEMGTTLAAEGARDLYAYWGDRIARSLDADLSDHADRTIVNLASNEYAKAALPHLSAPVVTPVFREEKDGQSRTLALFAKVARGAMARWVIENDVDRADDLRGFDAEGYAFRADASDEDRLVFTRPQPPKKR